jgi:hypothetical protein
MGLYHTDWFGQTILLPGHADNMSQNKLDIQLYNKEITFQ